MSDFSARKVGPNVYADIIALRNSEAHEYFDGDITESVKIFNFQVDGFTLGS